MTRPSFALTIAALRTTDARFDWVRPTPEEAELADLLAELEQHHQGGNDEPDDRGRYGRCTGCLEPWPCAAWDYGEELGLLYAIRACKRIWAHAQHALEAPA